MPKRNRRQRLHKPRVWNRHDPNVPQNAVYVGRPSKWGNPYTHLSGGTRASIKVDTREQAIEMYRTYITEKLEGDPKLRKALRRELRGRDLVCYCAPLPCHADILLELANSNAG